MPLRVFVTGASTGIGEALARHYAAKGATLGLVARRGPLLESLRAGWSSPSEIYPLDVRDAAALAAAARHFVGRHGCPEVVIANAGVSIGTLTEHEEDVAAVQEVMDINVLGMIKAFQPFIDCMRGRRTGKLVGIASVAGYRGLPGAGAYSASKAAVIAYLESLRVELRGSGIQVMTICPGYVATPMTRNNPYRMPFLMDANTAAGKIAAIIESGRSYAVIPWQMAIVARLLRVLPNALFDRLTARAARKPRRQA